MYQSCLYSLLLKLRIIENLRPELSFQKEDGVIHLKQDREQSTS